MRSNLILFCIIAVVGLACIGGCAYFVLQNTSSNSSQSKPEKEDETPATGGSKVDPARIPSRYFYTPGSENAYEKTWGTVINSRALETMRETTPTQCSQRCDALGGQCSGFVYMSSHIGGDLCKLLPANPGEREFTGYSSDTLLTKTPVGTVPLLKEPAGPSYVKESGTENEYRRVPDTSVSGTKWQTYNAIGLQDCLKKCTANTTCVACSMGNNACYLLRSYDAGAPIPEEGSTLLIKKQHEGLFRPFI